MFANILRRRTVVCNEEAETPTVVTLGEDFVSRFVTNAMRNEYVIVFESAM